MKLKESNNSFKKNNKINDKKNNIFDKIKSKVDFILSNFCKEKSLKMEIAAFNFKIFIFTFALSFFIIDYILLNQKNNWENNVKGKSKIVSKIILDEENQMIELAKNYAKSNSLYHALKNNLIITKNDASVKEITKPIKTKYDKIILLNDISNSTDVKKYIYDSKGELFAADDYDNKDILNYNKKFIEEHNNDIGVNIASLEVFNNDIYIISVSNVFAYSSNSLGYIILTKKVGENIIDDISNKINENVILFQNKNKKILTTSMFSDTKRIENELLNKINNKYLSYDIDLGKIDNSNIDGIISLVISKAEIDDKQNKSRLIMLIIYLLISLGYFTVDYRYFSKLLEKVSNNELELKNEKINTLTRILGGIAHELRTPLSSIRGLCDILINKIDGNKKIEIEVLKEYLKLMLKDSLRIDDIAGDIVDLFTKENELYLKDFKKINLKEIIQSACLEYDKEICEDIIIIKNNVINDYYINGISSKIENILKKLIKNSMEAQILEKLEIEIELTQDSDNYCILLKDNASGMNNTVIDKIFEPLYSTKIQCTGLGLTIVKKTVEKHGGKIEVESTIGIGTTFKIYFPKYKNS